MGGFSHRRRSSSSASSPQALNLHGTSASSASSPLKGSGQSLSPIPGTPSYPMSLSRTPSPRPGGGWASPGLNSSYEGLSGRSGAGTSVTWESAKAKSDGVNGGYPSFSTQNNGFFNRHYRSISNSLPRFNMGSDKSYAEKEKLGRGRWVSRDGSRLGRLRAAIGRTSRRSRISFLLFVGLILMYILFYSTRMYPSSVLWNYAD